MLAAGRSARMGEQKVILPLGGRSLVRRVVDAAAGAGVPETIVVVGYEAEAVRATLRDAPVRDRGECRLRTGNEHVPSRRYPRGAPGLRRRRIPSGRPALRNALP